LLGRRRRCRPIGWLKFCASSGRPLLDATPALPALRKPRLSATARGRVHALVYAWRMGQPTQRATNYTARSNIEPAQICLHANGQSAPRSGGARDVGRGAGSKFGLTRYKCGLTRAVCHRTDRPPVPVFTASGRYTPHALRCGNVDFQLPRGGACTL